MLKDGTNSYLNGQGLDHPLSYNNGSANSYYLQNQIGSTTRLTDSSGASTGRYQYLPYVGLLTSSTPVTGNPFTFTAREDDDTGLLYYRARYYDPSFQVFIPPDPFCDDQHYVGDNPLRYTDPLGREYWDFNFTGGAAGGITAGVFYGQTFKGSASTFHPYIGVGLMSPGASGSINYSPNTISPGYLSGQLGVELGPILVLSERR